MWRQSKTPTAGQRVEELLSHTHRTARRVSACQTAPPSSQGTPACVDDGGDDVVSRSISAHTSNCARKKTPGWQPNVKTQSWLSLYALTHIRVPLLTRYAALE